VTFLPPVTGGGVGLPLDHGYRKECRMPEDSAGRISRLMDRLEGPDVSEQETDQIMQKIEFLQRQQQEQQS
jgi:hypothetical protein